MALVAVILVIFVVCAIYGWAYGVKPENCKGMTRQEAADMVLKARRWAIDNGVAGRDYDGMSSSDLYVSGFERAPSGDDRYIVSVVYNDRRTGKRIGSADVYTDCEVEGRR